MCDGNKSVTVINYSNGKGAGSPPRKGLNTPPEVVHFSAFYVYNGVLWVELPARSHVTSV